MVRFSLHRRGDSHAAGAVGFTLIELLVVISIISLLVGILLPVLSAARGSAQAIQCGSNIRQLAIANITYAADNKQHFVRATSSDNTTRWHGGRDDPNNDPFDPAKGPLSDYFGERGRVKVCPTFDYFNDDDPGGMMAQTFEAGTGGYGYNKHSIGARYDTMSYPEAEEHSARTGDVRKPTETVLFTDTAFLASDAPHPYIEYSFCEAPQTSFGGASPSIHFRHDGRANVAWADGHVSRRKLEFSHSYWFGVSSDQAADRGLGWFGTDDNTLFDLE